MSKQFWRWYRLANIGLVLFLIVALMPAVSPKPAYWLDDFSLLCLLVLALFVAVACLGFRLIKMVMDRR